MKKQALLILIMISIFYQCNENAPDVKSSTPDNNNNGANDINILDASRMKAVLNEVDLPLCNQTNAGSIYYIINTDTFKYCYNGTYTVINFISSGNSMSWQGSLAVAPASPLTNWAYYNTTDGVSYIFDGTSWQILAQDGGSFSDNNYILKSTVLSDTTSFTCNGTYGSTSISEYYTMASGGTGTPYKICTSEFCGSSIPNGTYLRYVASGTNCLNYEAESFTCNSGFTNINSECVAVCGVGNLHLCLTQLDCNNNNGFWTGSQCIQSCASGNLLACSNTTECSAAGGVWDGTACLAGCSAYDLNSCVTSVECTAVNGYWWNNSCNTTCPEGQVESSRGCETPIASCTATQTIEDNLCVDIIYTSISGNLCGTYSNPVRILSGTHIVTCDTNFESSVLMDAGAILLVDDYWSINAKNIKVLGTAVNRVEIKPSLGNPLASWNKFTVKNGSALYNKTGYLSGNRLENIFITGNAANEIDYATISFLETTATSTFKTVYIDNSLFNGNITFTKNAYQPKTLNYLLNSTMNGTTSIMYNKTIAAWNIFNNTLTINMNDTTLSAGVYFSTINSILCYGPGDSLVIGNQVAGGTISANCSTVLDNAATVSAKTAIYLLNDFYFTGISNQTFKIMPLVLNSTGWLTYTLINVSAQYAIDGIMYPYATTWSGLQPTVSFSSPEMYYITIDDIDGNMNITGELMIPASIQ